MPTPSRSILVLNGGSSSIRFALLRANDEPRRPCGATTERIGRDDAQLAIDAAAPAEARHGVVHGMRHFDPERVTPDLMAGLRIRDVPRNADAPGLISSPTGRVAVHVIRTNEAQVIARAVRDLLAFDAARHESPR